MLKRKQQKVEKNEPWIPSLLHILSGLHTIRNRLLFNIFALHNLVEHWVLHNLLTPAFFHSQFPKKPGDFSLRKSGIQDNKSSSISSSHNKNS